MKKNKLNIYGDRGQGKLKMGYCGYDISSQRLDELDKEENSKLEKEFKLSDKINIAIGIIIAFGTIILVYFTWR